MQLPQGSFAFTCATVSLTWKLKVQLFMNSFFISNYNHNKAADINVGDGEGGKTGLNFWQQRDEFSAHHFDMVDKLFFFWAQKWRKCFSKRVINFTLIGRMAFVHLSK